MPALRALFHRIAGLFGRQRREREFGAELEANLQLHIEDNLRRGLAPAEAHRQALIALGGLEAAKESHREQRGLPFLDTLAQDVRFALRTLRKTPGFTAVAVLTLALGIGANTAIFSVVNAVLLRPLPFADSDRLVAVWEDATFVGFPHNTPAPANFVDWRSQNHVFTDMAATSEASFNLTGGGDPERIEGYRTGWNVFPLLGVQPILGRTFLPEEDAPGGEKVVLLSYELWRRRFGGEASAVGSEISVNGQKHRIIGVMPAGFHFPFNDAEIWTPLQFTQKEWNKRGDHFLSVFARLKPGVSLSTARADMSVLASRLAADHPDTNHQLGAVVVPLREEYAGNSRRGLLVLLAAVGFILLIACANVANLLLARSTGRAREVAVRRALGATAGRLARQLATENLLLAGLGCAFGVGLADWSLNFLRQLVPADLSPLVPLQLDTRVLLFTLGATAGTWLLFGLAPLLEVIRLDVNAGLQEASTRAGGGRSSRMRSGLVISEVALTLVLLIGAVLLLRSFGNLRGLDPGFRSAGVLTMRLYLSRTAYPDAEKRAAFFERAMKELRSLPGVDAAEFTSALPLVWKGGTTGFLVEGGAPSSPSLPYDANNRVVSPGYMHAMGMSLLAGRFFADTDNERSQPVVIVNETMASMYFPGRDPLTCHIRVEDSPAPPWLTVVGVVKDIKSMGLDLPARPEMYFPYRQAFDNWMAPRDVILRTQGDPLRLAAAARQRIWLVDPNQPVSDVSTLDNILDEEVTERRVQSLLLGAFSILALILACIGLYGVLAFLVAQRTREIALRLALGAHPRDILASFLARGLALALAGIAIGLAAALALSRLLDSILFGVSPRDLLTFSLVPAVLLVISLAASLIPARRAMRVAPASALRCE